MKKIILAILLTVSATAAIFAAETAQTETQDAAATISTVITGKVTDKVTNEALAGVSVVVNGQKVYTDLEGNFKVLNVRGATCEVKVDLISYQPQTISVNTTNQQTVSVALSQR